MNSVIAYINFKPLTGLTKYNKKSKLKSLS